VQEMSWGTLIADAAEIAAFGKARIDGKVSYLATIRRSGKPRIHPVTAIVGDDRCFIFAEPASSKVKDLEKNNAFSLHCGMSDSSGSSGEFQLAGLLVRIDDVQLRAAAEKNCSYRPSSNYHLYEMCLSEAIATSYRGGRAFRNKWSCSSSE
jgi:hypothetical protein